MIAATRSGSRELYGIQILVERKCLAVTAVIPEKSDQQANRGKKDRSCG